MPQIKEVTKYQITYNKDEQGPIDWWYELHDSKERAEEYLLEREQKLLENRKKQLIISTVAFWFNNEPLGPSIQHLAILDFLKNNHNKVKWLITELDKLDGTTTDI